MIACYGAGVGNGNPFSRILAWESPWTEEPGGLYSPWGSQRVGHRLGLRRHMVRVGRRVQGEPNSTLLSARRDWVFYRESERRDQGSVVREVKE